MITDSLAYLFFAYFLSSTIAARLQWHEESYFFAYRLTLLDSIGVEAWATIFAETLDSWYLARDTLANTAYGARFLSTQIGFIDNYRGFSFIKGDKYDRPLFLLGRLPVAVCFPVLCQRSSVERIGALRHT